MFFLKLPSWESAMPLKLGIMASLLSLAPCAAAISTHHSHLFTHGTRVSAPALLRQGWSPIHRPRQTIINCDITTTTTLCLGPINDTEDSSDSELDLLISKRKGIKKKKAANTKPDDDKPPIEEMSDEEIAAMLSKEETAIDDLFSRDYMPDWKTKRAKSSIRREKGQGGLSSGDGEEEGEDGAEVDEAVFIDWMEDYEDENEFHVPNRIGFTTADWGNEKKGFVKGKLKKKDRKAGKFNKADLRRAYEKLQQNGISFVETSESYGLSSSSSSAEEILNQCMEQIEPGDRPIVASTFSNPWKHALQSRSLPRFGSKAIVNAAEKSIKNMGIFTMDLYQIQNPWFYIGGSTALANGMLEVIADDHAKYVGSRDLSIGQLQKLQRKLRDQGEFLATNQFEFSLTNRKALTSGIIDACKKLGITPIARNVLDGGLATGKYTSTNPTGGEVTEKESDTGPYPLRKLEKLDALFQTQDRLRETIGRRIGSEMLRYEAGNTPNINKDITTTQIAINYVRAKGAIPLVSVTSLKQANELLGCLGWDMTDDEIELLDGACKDCGL